MTLHVGSLEPMPDHIAKGLNREQLAAVTTGAGCHHLVLAGAGCGKTTVLTRRMAFLSHTGVALSNVLALTFTRKAADEMAERTASLCRKAVLPFITTFHGFALSTLSATTLGRSNFSRLGFFGKVRGCEGDERLRLLAECSGSEERQHLGCTLLQLDAHLERLAVFPEKFSEYSSEKGALLKTVASRFTAKKKSLGVWDFSDLIEGCVELFSEHQEVLAFFRNRFSHILVDEFQDTNPVQIVLLSQLLGEDKYLYAVGDDDQAIYAFRGADIRPTLQFSTYFKGAEIIKLQTNYRSTPAILSKVNRVFSDKDPKYRKVLEPGLKNAHAGARPVVKKFIGQEPGARWILDKALALSLQKSIPLAAMAILFRTNQSQEWMRSFLNGCGLTEMPNLLTVHKSKGLEFRVVFLCDMEETLFPLYRMERKKRLRTVFDVLGALLRRNNATPPIDIAEERRLFYVAVTRAREYLYLIHVRRRENYGRPQRFEPSRFLKYMR